MSIKTTAHINFHSEARTALEFYKSVFGGEITIATYADIHAVETAYLSFHVTALRPLKASEPPEHSAPRWL